MLRADYLKILNHLNKKFFKNQLKVKIVFLNKIIDPRKKGDIDKGIMGGRYRCENKTIALLKDDSEIELVLNLIHEIIHSVQHQIWNEPLSHDQRGWRLYKKLMKETNKMLKISLKDFFPLK